jgi:hypothetical protein
MFPRSTSAIPCSTQVIVRSCPDELAYVPSSFDLVKDWAWKSADCFRAQVGGHKNRCAREIYVFREALVAVIEKKAHTRAHPGMTEQ